MREPVEWPTTDPLAHRVATTPDATATVDADADEEWSYRELDERVAATASALDERVTTGDRVCLLLPTGVRFPTVAAAVWRLGGSIVPLDVERPADEMRAQIDRVDPAAVVRGDDADVDVSVPTLSADDISHEGTTHEGRGGRIEPAAWHRNDEALVAFTSGTTGTPKGVRLTLGNLVASATASAFRLGVDPGDRWLVALPMYHLGGLSPFVRSTLYGTTTVIQRGFDARRTATVIEDRNVTCVSLVPTQLRRLLDAGWSPPDSLRFVLLGGAPADGDLIADCRRRDVPVCPTYGLTETASQVATAVPSTAFAHEGTVGRPLVCTDVTIVGEDGRPVERGQRGEIVVDGPTVTPGYLDDERTAAAFGEHGLHTGDVGYADGDGRLWVVGRLDDRIHTGGENVHPSRVADALRDHAAVADAAVVGVPDDEWGERVAALVVTTDGAADDTDGDDSITAADLRAHCRERLATYEVPKTVAFAEQLPRTSSGTVDRDAVRERLGGP